MVVLSAGVFANLVACLAFFLILILFFQAFYSPAGYVFDNYAFDEVNTEDIVSFTETRNNKTIISTKDFNYTYFGDINSFTNNTKNSNGTAVLYFDSPAIRHELDRIIIAIDGQKVKTREDISFYLSQKKPGDAIIVETLSDENQITKKTLILGENPADKDKPFLGVMNYGVQKKGLFSQIINFVGSFKNKNTYYSPKYNSILTVYFYDLLWWIVMINLFVAMFNMLPLGILDGGRFFYLAVWSITKNEKIAKKSFKIATRIILMIFLLMIIFWLISLF